MLKAQAIELLGGTISAAADAIGISYEAVHKWPDVLSGRIEDRVIAALARRQMPDIGTASDASSVKQEA